MLRNSNFKWKGWFIYMLLDKKIQDILEKNEFNFDEKISEQDNGKYIEINQSTPEGEDWWETIWFDGTYEGFVNAVEERVLNFDVDEEVEIWIPNRGKGGCPDSIMDLVHDAEWKQKTLENLLDDLQENKKEEKEITKESVENELYDFFNDKMKTGDAPEIEGVWKQYDPANGNIITIDCVGGKQIRFIIQVD